MRPKRLAIVGGGGSGLVTLKHALDELPDWEIVCFEKSATTTGCWGDPYPGFVSTSTKYATQFSCFRRWSTEVDPADRATKADFYRDGEYGEYLDDFVRHFRLASHIRRSCPVVGMDKCPEGWRLTFEDRTETFDRVVLATGLAARARTIDTDIPCLDRLDERVAGETVVVLGGGESATDIAHRLARPSLGNTVYLSLNNGIRVSPRYHPIRGVPSDFLRTRLMLSIDPDLRNWIGQKFVEARIRHQERFETLFRSKGAATEWSADVVARRKRWDAKLTARAKDRLFNTFHTKSEDFLDDVGHGRIQIVGPPVDGGYRRYREFDGPATVDLAPDLLVPRIGFRSGLDELTDGEIRVEQFYLGSIHAVHDDLYLVGSARPILGNIPTISEMQARLVTRMVAGKVPRPEGIGKLHAAERRRLAEQFPQLDVSAVHPVEMFPYCDRLAHLLGTYPSFGRLPLGQWLKIQLAPASTTHYLDADFDPRDIARSKIHSPPVILLLLAWIRMAQPVLRWLAPNDETPAG